jgi:hypothetical protein
MLITGSLWGLWNESVPHWSVFLTTFAFSAYSMNHADEQGSREEHNPRREAQVNY